MCELSRREGEPQGFDGEHSSLSTSETRRDEDNKDDTNAGAKNTPQTTRTPPSPSPSHRHNGPHNNNVAAINITITTPPRVTNANIHNHDASLTNPLPRRSHSRPHPPPNPPLLPASNSPKIKRLPIFIALERPPRIKSVWDTTSKRP